MRIFSQGQECVLSSLESNVDAITGSGLPRLGTQRPLKEKRENHRVENCKQNQMFDSSQGVFLLDGQCK